MSLIEQPFPALFPEIFFDASACIYPSSKLPLARGKRKFLLPDVSALLDEEKFADFYMSWDSEGLSLLCQVERPFIDCVYPSFDEGDSLELFIDTRDLKEVGVIHRFCHHFLFLPVEVQGVRSLEVTNFRGEDKHSLADPAQLCVETTFEKKSYCYAIYLSREVLYGYDPVSIPRLGFSYRLHRAKGRPQHFPLSTKACAIERFPALWASLQLKESI